MDGASLLQPSGRLSHGWGLHASKAVTWMGLEGAPLEKIGFDEVSVEGAPLEKRGFDKVGLEGTPLEKRGFDKVSLEGAPLHRTALHCYSYCSATATALLLLRRYYCTAPSLHCTTTALHYCCTALLLHCTTTAALHGASHATAFRKAVTWVGRL